MVERPHKSWSVARRARRRILLVRLARVLGRSLAVGSISAVVLATVAAAAVDRQAGLIVVVACLVLAAASAVVRVLLRPGSLTVAAARVDASLGLKDRLSSAIELHNRHTGEDSAFTSLAIADGEKAAADADVRRAAPLRLDASWIIWPLASAAAIAAVFFLPIALRRGTPRIDQARIAAAQETIAQSAADLQSVVDQAPAPDPADQEALNRVRDIEQALASGKRTPDEAITQAAAVLEQHAQDLEQRANQAQELADRLEQLDPEQAGEASDLAAALREANMSEARQIVQDMLNRSKTMNSEDRSRLANDLRRLAEQVRQQQQIEPEPPISAEQDQDSSDQPKSVTDSANPTQEQQPDTQPDRAPQQNGQRPSDQNQTSQSRSAQDEPSDKQPGENRQSSGESEQSPDRPAQPNPAQPKSTSPESPQTPEPAADHQAQSQPAPEQQDDAHQGPPRQSQQDAERQPDDAANDQTSQSGDGSGAQQDMNRLAQSIKDVADAVEQKQQNPPPDQNPQPGEQQSPPSQNPQPRPDQQDQQRQPSATPGEEQKQSARPSQGRQPAESQSPSEPDKTQGAQPDNSGGNRPQQERPDGSANPDEQPGAADDQDTARPGAGPGDQAGHSEQADRVDPNSGDDRARPTDAPAADRPQQPGGTDASRQSRAARHETATDNPSQADADQSEADHPNGQSGGGDGMSDSDTIDRALEQFEKMDQQQRDAVRKMAQSQELRKRAQELLEHTTPEQRQRLQALADRLRHDMSESASEPWNPETELFDARDTNDSEDAGRREVGQIEPEPQQPTHGFNRTEDVVSQVKEAAAGAERAIEGQIIPRRYRDYVRSVYRRFEERAASQPAPEGRDAGKPANSDESTP